MDETVGMTHTKLLCDGYGSEGLNATECDVRGEIGTSIDTSKGHRADVIYGILTYGSNHRFTGGSPHV